MHRHSNRHKYIHIYPDRGRHLAHIHTDVETYTVIQANTDKYINKYILRDTNILTQTHSQASKHSHTDTDIQAYIHRCRHVHTGTDRYKCTDTDIDTQTYTKIQTLTHRHTPPPFNPVLCLLPGRAAAPG